MELRTLSFGLIGAAALSWSATMSAAAADVEQMKRDAWSWLESQTGILETANQNIWSYAETSL